MKLTKRGLALLVAASIVGAVRMAMAGDPVEEHIDRGLMLRQEGRPADALVEFQKAHAAAPSGRTLAQMGFAEQQLREWIDAEQHLAAALADERSEWIRSNRSPIEKSLSTVRTHIGDLLVLGPRDASVEVDGKPLGLLPLAKSARLREGEATVVVIAAGGNRFAERIRIAGGGTATVDASPRPRDSFATAPSPEPSPRKSGVLDARSSSGPEAVAWPPQKVLGVGLLGAGAAAAVLGGMFLILDGRAECTARPGFECDSRRRSSTAGLALVGAGVGVALIGGVLFYRGSSQSPVAIRVAPRGAWIEGTF